MKALCLFLVWLLVTSSRDKNNYQSTSSSSSSVLSAVLRQGTSGDIHGDYLTALSRLKSHGQKVVGDADNVDIDRVVDILRSNVKQWSFVESQLMEPNVNLHMPEIFIPLRHLSTTLELLGNILFMREENLAAMESLERACPLMELLPQHAIDEVGAQAHRGLVDAMRLASGCFSLLRQVYAREKDLTPPPVALSSDAGLYERTSMPSVTTTSIDLFDPDRRFAELRSPYHHLRRPGDTATEDSSLLHSGDRQCVRPEASSFDDGDGGGDSSLTDDIDVLMRRFLVAEGVVRLELLSEAERALEAALARVKRMGRSHRRGSMSTFDSSLAKQYLAVMHQINKDGVGFVDAERSQLSLAIALSYEEGGETLSTTDKNRLFVLDAISEAMMRMSRAPSEVAREEPYEVLERPRTIFDPPPPVIEQMPIRHAQKSQQRRRSSSSGRGSLESILLALLAFSSIAFVLFLLHSEVYRKGGQEESSIFDVLNTPHDTVKPKRQPEGRRRKDKKKRADKGGDVIVLGDLVEDSDSEPEMVVGTSMRDILVDTASLGVDDCGEEDWTRSDVRRRWSDSSNGSATGKTALKEAADAVVKKISASSPVAAQQGQPQRRPPKASTPVQLTKRISEGSPVSVSAPAHAPVTNGANCNGNAWTKLPTAASSIDSSPPTFALPLPIMSPITSPAPSVSRRQRGPQDDFGSSLALVSPPPVMQPVGMDPPAVTIALLVRCVDFPPGHSLNVRVTTASVGRLDTAKALPMRRSIVDGAVWILTLRVPLFFGADFAYRYSVYDSSSRGVFEETNERRIYLSEADESVEQEDLLTAASLSLMVL